MARKTIVEKWKKKLKHKTRTYTKCRLYRKPHSVLRKLGICRVCFRELAYKDEISGCRGTSWQYN